MRELPDEYKLKIAIENKTMLRYILLLKFVFEWVT